MREFGDYYGKILRRAWAEACALMFPDSWKVAIRDGIIFLVAVVAMYALKRPLADRGLIGATDNPIIDNGLPFLFGLAALVAIFAAYFLLEALFVTPYRMWREAEARDPARPIFEAADEPHREWVSLRDAPFVVPFWSEYQDGGGWTAAWLDEMLAPISVPGPPRHPEMKRNVASEQARNDLGHDLVVARIDWEKRAFVWRWERPATETTPAGYFGVSPYPEDMTTEGPYWKTFIGESAYKWITSWGGHAWLAMRDAVTTMIRNGDAVVMARIGDPTAKFSRIALDSWQHFKIQSWRNGYATAEGSAVLCSIHLARAKGAVP